MQNTLSEKIRIAAQELRLTDTQRNIVAHRLTRALLKIDAEAVSVEELRQLITDSLVGVPGAVARAPQAAREPQPAREPGVAREPQPAVAAKPAEPEIIEVDEAAYRVNHVVKRTSNG